MATITTDFDTLFSAADTALDDLFGGRLSLTFAAHDGTKDEHGQPTYHVDGDWDDVVTVTGFVGAMAAGERMRGGQTNNTITHQLRVAFNASIAKGQRVTLPDGTTIYVQGIRDPDQHQMELVIEGSRTL